MTLHCFKVGPGPLIFAVYNQINKKVHKYVCAFVKCLGVWHCYLESMETSYLLKFKVTIMHT